MPDDEKEDRRIIPSVNACHDYVAGGIRWRRIANVNGNIENTSLVFR